MTNLLDKLLKAGSIENAAILEDSPLYSKRDIIPTDLPILNMAFAGDLDEGMVPGLTVFAGPSKTYKTLLALFCAKAYQDKYEDSVIMIFDSEGSLTPDYIKSIGINPSKVIQIPVMHVEQLKFDMVKRLEAIERGDRVFVLVDSIGSLPSKKEVDDALNDNSAADMSRAKALRSLLRIITPHFTFKDIPGILINHTYETMEMYAKTIQGGGTAMTFMPNTVFFFSKAQDKNPSTGEIEGWYYTLTVDKSRFVREKTKFKFHVDYEEGIDKYSSLLELAIEAKMINKMPAGWYQMIDLETGEIDEKKIREKDIPKSFFDQLLKNNVFKKFVRNEFKLVPGE
jgi:RecA/RadA recombinase